MQITYLRVAMVVAELDQGRGFDRAASDDAALLYRLAAAHAHGAYPPFCGAARELDDWLGGMRAGRALCRAAWRRFTDGELRRMAGPG